MDINEVCCCKGLVNSHAVGTCIIPSYLSPFREDVGGGYFNLYVLSEVWVLIGDETFENLEVDDVDLYVFFATSWRESVVQILA